VVDPVDSGPPNQPRSPDQPRKPDARVAGVCNGASVTRRATEKAGQRERNTRECATAKARAAGGAARARGRDCGGIGAGRDGGASRV